VQQFDMALDDGLGILIATFISYQEPSPQAEQARMLYH
jgi:hypothetical protein